MLIKEASRIAGPWYWGEPNLQPGVRGGAGVGGGQGRRTDIQEAQGILRPSFFRSPCGILCIACT